MKFEFFVAKRLIRAKQSKFSRPIVVVAIASIALGIAVMLLSVFVLSGFKSGIREKIAGFSSHLQIVPYKASNSYLSEPITLTAEEQKRLSNIEGVRSITPFVLKGAAIKTKTDFMGVVLKGIDKSYNRDFFEQHLKEGKLIQVADPTNEVLVSRQISDKMELHIGDKIRIFFYIDQTYRQRALTIAGIYETGLSIYDDKMIICDMRVLQGLNLWAENQYEGYEVLLQDFDKLQSCSQMIYQELDQDKTIQTIAEIEPSLFAWLDLLDSNVVVILSIMMLVSIVVITSALLIMIFEKTEMIGILKGFGATTQGIVKIFLYKAVYIIVKGLMYGNILALAIGLIQLKYGFFTLDAQSYYLDHVPININFWIVAIVNVAAVIICTITLLVPARSISKISPVSNINME